MISPKDENAQKFSEIVQPVFAPKQMLQCWALRERALKPLFPVIAEQWIIDRDLHHRLAKGRKIRRVKEDCL
jgi:hypothetical protein